MKHSDACAMLNNRFYPLAVESMAPDPRPAHRDNRYWCATRFAQVQAAKRERARRAVYLPSELFTEPAWDILLEMYSLELVARPVTESLLTERSNVPPTTSIRWMKMLEVARLIIRTPDPDNPADVRVVLTSEGISAMDGYFSNAN